MPIENKNRWIVSKFDNDEVGSLSIKTGVSKSIIKLLLNRGMDTPDKIDRFFNPSLEYCYNPFLMKGMKKAVQRLRQAILEKSKILVFGDFDVDGLTGTALLFRGLLEICCESSLFSRIPDRISEGYGLNKQIFDFVKEKKIDVIITVDCGISNEKEAALAKEYSIDLIITDHHHPPPILPDAYAIINPKQDGCSYPFKDLSGVGVAMKLLHGVFSYEKKIPESLYLPLPEPLWEHLDLVALGTVADIVPLLDENRIFVKHGLKILSSSRKAGIRALKKVSGLDCKSIDSFDVGFKLAPRINAAGRVGDASKGLALLTTDQENDAELLAEELDNENQKRKSVEKGILSEALEMCAREDVSKKNIIVLSSQNWHPGVIGIVASRLLNKFFLPTLLIALKDGIGRGSARSIPGFHIYDNVSLCEDLLVSFGGHECAAGLSIEEGNISKLKSKLEKLATQTLTKDDLQMSFAVESEISIDSLSIEEVNAIGDMAPFGEGNREPMFSSKNIQVMKFPNIVGNNHLRMKVRDKNKVIGAIGFQMGGYKEFLVKENIIDIVFIPQINCWRNQREVQLKIKDIKFRAKADYP